VAGRRADPNQSGTSEVTWSQCRRNEDVQQGATEVLPLEGCPTVKKGRHRRFEEARKLKQSGPGAFDLGLGGGGHEDRSHAADDNDEYAALAEKYGVTFDDDEEDDDF
jgi:hypothetical protein